MGAPSMTSRYNEVHKEETAFVNNFWDDADVGYSHVVNRVKNSVSTMQELLDYYLERINIEKDYSRKLERLNSLPLGRNETGVLKKSLDKLNYENNQMVKFNTKFVKSVNQINYEKLNHFYVMYTKKTKRIMSHIHKIVTKKTDILKDLTVTKEAYKQNCSQVKSLGLTVQTTWGKELEKNEKKLEKLQQSSQVTERNYRISIDNFNKINEIFKRDWMLALSEIYQLEIERIQLIKINCFNFCNNVATLCVDNDQSADLARSFFAKISPPQDIQDFSNNYGTGNKILVEPKFIDFMKGLDDENDKNYETAEFEIPEFNHLLSRSYSTYSSATQQSRQSQTTQPLKQRSFDPQASPEYRRRSFDPQSSPERKHRSLEPQTPSPIKTSAPEIPPPKTSTVEPLTTLSLPKPEDTKSNYSTNNLSPDERTDIFSIKSHKFNDSNGSSNYSNPTNYSSNSAGERTWASPRKREKQLSQFQEKINLKSKDLPSLDRSTTSCNASPTKTPITKDFSIDFIAKALEDLNSGGNGDVSQYRRSMRISRHQDELTQSQTAPTTPFAMKIRPERDDHGEVPTRVDTISFKSPQPKRTMDPLSVKQKVRPKSMYESVAFDAAKSVNPQMRTLSRPRSFTNLHSMISQVTPVNKKPFLAKARARYSYKPQHQGELFFRKGWNMYVIHKQPDNWYLCELGDNCDEKVGLMGLVPGNYVVEGDDVF
ncbi:formin-binding protein [Yamadazyma tenuis]|uniref:F-BAR domain-containing protein n=1 Tax=Candida tenuis (strain ATCC 10573 / BCRC 21748 / CBS 615 / JCM 9827 / NBRC 10315 / NRRL Y-1498 / VKM Y-70) TaxID=590646 RepID=G3B3D4_CANTC|nr:uncharacterized protein CANTEDRAFT_93650 [Yamadazyma tenuis ATCC 10573]EGV64141.1 hypothetical protein CANTEDRAFT_93650 [Yamadazyma tenuis ATCC 10573]WEJ96220.1 formin-binding protein [Yamadazyma tenuis]